jgi:hypothetical protein
VAIREKSKLKVVKEVRFANCGKGLTSPSQRFDTLGREIGVQEMDEFDWEKIHDRTEKSGND